MASLDELDAQLRAAMTLLEGTTPMIRSLGLNPAINVRRIAEALVEVFEIQREIYALRPDLTPDFLKRTE